MSIEDEKVLFHYRNSNQLENGKNYLQFKLPWIEDTGKLKNNFSQGSQKYCEKMKAAIEEGHLVKFLLSHNQAKSPREQNPADIATREFSTRESKNFKHCTQGLSAFHSPGERSYYHFPTSKACTVEQTTSGNCGEVKATDIGFMEHTPSRTNDLNKALRISVS